MVPRLGEKHRMRIEVISKSREEYTSAAYAELGLPLAPAIMIEEEIVVEKADISEDDLEAAIERIPEIAGRTPWEESIEK